MKNEKCNQVLLLGLLFGRSWCIVHTYFTYLNSIHCTSFTFRELNTPESEKEEGASNVNPHTFIYTRITISAPSHSWHANDRVLENVYRDEMHFDFRCFAAFYVCASVVYSLKHFGRIGLRALLFSFFWTLSTESESYDDMWKWDDKLNTV